MKKNQKGFSVVEILIVIVVIGLIGGVGYYVWQSREKQSQPKTESQVTQTDKNSENSKEKYITVGEHKVFYTPPDDWSEEIELADPDTQKDSSGSVIFTSNDYKLDDTDQSCAIAASGKKIYIIIEPTKDDNDEFIKSIINPAPDSPEAIFTANAKQTTIAGQKAVQYSSTPGECGWSRRTDTVVSKYVVSTSIALDSYTSGVPFIKEPYNTIYNSLLSSIRY